MFFDGLLPSWKKINSFFDSKARFLEYIPRINIIFFQLFFPLRDLLLLFLIESKLIIFFKGFLFSLVRESDGNIENVKKSMEIGRKKNTINQ